MSYFKSFLGENGKDFVGIVFHISKNLFHLQTKRAKIGVSIIN